MTLLPLHVTTSNCIRLPFPVLSNANIDLKSVLSSGMTTRARKSMLTINMACLRRQFPWLSHYAISAVTFCSNTTFLTWLNGVLGSSLYSGKGGIMGEFSQRAIVPYLEQLCILFWCLFNALL